MKKHIVIGLVFVLLMIGFSGCTSRDDFSDIDELLDNKKLSAVEEQFVGTWIMNSDYFFTLFSDKTGSWEREACKWEVKEGKLVIDLENGQRFVPEYFFIDNDTLKLTSTLGIEYIYEKQ